MSREQPYQDILKPLEDLESSISFIDQAKLLFTQGNIDLSDDIESALQKIDAHLLRNPENKAFQILKNKIIQKIPDFQKGDSYIAEWKGMLQAIEIFDQLVLNLEKAIRLKLDSPENKIKFHAIALEQLHFIADLDIYQENDPIYTLMSKYADRMHKHLNLVGNLSSEISQTVHDNTTYIRSINTLTFDIEITKIMNELHTTTAEVLEVLSTENGKMIVLHALNGIFNSISELPSPREILWALLQLPDPMKVFQEIKDQIV